MTTTPNMGLVLPDEGGSADVWAVLLDAMFAQIDAHDHTTGKGAPVPSAALNINASIQLASAGNHYALYDAQAFDFFPTPPANVAAFAGALFMSNADNELYWRNASGTNVKVTAGSALNVAAFTGGIGGDYSAVGALDYYDDATHRYLLQQQGSPRPWAGVAMGNLDIYQQAASIVNRVRLQSPAALAASYALTMFAALPGAQSLVQLDAAGLLTASNTLLNNANLTLQGTGYVQRGTRKTTVPILANASTVAAGAVSTVGGSHGANLAVSTDAYFAIPIPSSDNQIAQLASVVVNNGITGTGNVTWGLYAANGVLGIFSALSTYGAQAIAGVITINATAPIILNHQDTLWLRVTTAGTNSGRIYSAEINTTVP